MQTYEYASVVTDEQLHTIHCYEPSFNAQGQCNKVMRHPVYIFSARVAECMRISFSANSFHHYTHLSVVSCFPAANRCRVRVWKLCFSGTVGLSIIAS